MMRLGVLLLAACSHAAAPVANQPRSAPEQPPAEVTGVAPMFVVRYAPMTAPSVLGEVWGKLSDTSSEPLVGATVVLTGPRLVGEQVVITDEGGWYRITGVPPGRYTLTYYYMNRTFVHRELRVLPGTMTRERGKDFPMENQRPASCIFNSC